MRSRSRFLALYRIVANGRFTSGIHCMEGYFRMDGKLIYLVGRTGPAGTVSLR